MRIAIDSRLTEQKLAAALMAITGNAWQGVQYKLPDSRRRFDMAFRTEDSLVLVEYDGDEHYRNSLKIKIDGEKQALAASHGARLVRVPYWVQLDHETARFYFGAEADIDQSFPHGFITTSYYPASFCELGVERFRSELGALPACVRSGVIEYLRDRAREHGDLYVLPTTLNYLLAT